MADESDDGSDRITFRVDSARKERFENLVNLHNALVDSDETVTKSQLLRDSVDQHIADLEAELRDQVGALEEFLDEDDEGNQNPLLIAE